MGLLPIVLPRYDILEGLRAGDLNRWNAQRRFLISIGQGRLFIVFDFSVIFVIRRFFGWDILRFGRRLRVRIIRVFVGVDDLAFELENLRSLALSLASILLQSGQFFLPPLFQLLHRLLMIVELCICVIVILFERFSPDRRRWSFHISRIHYLVIVV